MFHPDTQLAVDLWTALAQGDGARGGVPARSALRPEAFGRALARVALVEGSGRDAVFRLAGGAIETLHGRGLKGRPASRLWTSPTVDRFDLARTQALSEGRPLVLEAVTDQEALAVQIVVAPLRDGHGRADLSLLTFAWSGELSRLAGGVRRLAIASAIPVGEPRRPRLGLAALDGRRLG